MKYWIFLFVLIVFACGHAYGHKDTLHAKGEIRFIENKKQWKDCILFKADLQQGVLFAEKNCFTFVLSHPDNPKYNHAYIPSKNTVDKYHSYKLHFSNSNVNPNILSQNPAEDYENYFIGNDPAHWASGVRNYESVYYENIYQGIDLKLYSQNAFLKYDFVVQPFASHQQIVLKYEGLDGIRIQNKNLVLSTSVGEVIELMPVAYQIINEKKIAVDAQYVLEKNIATFKIGDYEQAYPLVIDPMLVFSTYTGSLADNWGYTATYDKKGNVYTAGIVRAQGYPVNTGAYDETFNGGSCDVAIFKLNPRGTNRLFATYLGGDAPDMPHSMIVNELNELVVFGTTGSSDFPTSANAYCRTFKEGSDTLKYLSAIIFPKGSDIFVCRFSEDGTQLPASTYIGGTGNDGLNFKNQYNDYEIMFRGNNYLYGNYGDGARGELIVDDLSNVYVGSCTFSSDFPVTSNAFQPVSKGGQEGITFKLDYNLSNLLWSSYLGGSGDDAIYSIDVDSEYNLIVAGGTTSRNFPTTSNANKRNYAGGNTDGFVTRIAYAGNVIMNSTYFGSSEYDQTYFVRTDRNDNVYIAGSTKALGATLVYSSIERPLYNVPNSGQFVAKLDINLRTLYWSTVFGSGDLTCGPDLSLTAFAVDQCDRIYLSGWGRCWAGQNNIPWGTYGTTRLPTTPGAYQSQTDGQDFYIISLKPDAEGLDYATFMGELHKNTILGPNGNDHVDGGTSRFDKYGNLYQSVCASCNGTQAFPIAPTPGAWSVSNNSANCNNAIFSFNVHNDFAVADFILPRPVCKPDSVKFQNTGRGDHFYWDFGDGSISSEQNPTHLFTQPGLFTVTQIAYVNSGCSLTDTIKKQVMILGDTSYFLPDIYTCPNQSVQIGLTPVQGMTYHWNTAQELTDSTISNPFATVAQNTLFYMFVSNGFCTDTIYQYVKITHPPVDAGDDINTCISPSVLTANPYSTGVIYQWSSDNSFTDTLNASTSNNTALVYFSSSQYYYVKVTDANGCFNIDSLYVTYQPISYPPVFKSASCYGLCDGEASVTPMPSAILPIAYHWSTGGNDSTIQNLCAGSYSITVEDGAGCSQTQPFQIAQPKRIMSVPTIVSARCSNICDGSINLQVSGGTPPYRYLWSTGETTSFIQNLCEGTYSVIIRDINNCEHFDTFMVSKSFSADITLQNNTCKGYCTGIAVATPINGKPPFSYSWSNGKLSDTIKNLCAGEYSLITTDSEGCKTYDTIEILNVYTFDTNIHVWADKYEIVEDEKTVLHATPINNVSYLWSPGTNLSTPTRPDTDAKPPQTTLYYLQCTDWRGCVYRDSILINVIVVNCGEPNIFIPNAFTPNNDEKNDRLCVGSQWVTSYYFAIFNRWGEKVFETSESSACWDGTYKGKICEQGVYVYTLEVDCRANKHYKTKGNITLIR